MKTINGLLHFLNKLDLVADLETDEFKKFNCIKKVLTNEIRDLDTSHFINVLFVVDDVQILIIIQDFKNVQVSTNVLRDDIFLLFNEKMKNEKWIICYHINGCRSKKIFWENQTIFKHL